MVTLLLFLYCRLLYLKKKIKILKVLRKSCIVWSWEVLCAHYSPCKLSMLLLLRIYQAEMASKLNFSSTKAFWGFGKVFSPTWDKMPKPQNFLQNWNSTKLFFRDITVFPQQECFGASRMKYAPWEPGSSGSPCTIATHLASCWEAWKLATWGVGQAREPATQEAGELGELANRGSQEGWEPGSPSGKVPWSWEDQTPQQPICQAAEEPCAWRGWGAQHLSSLQGVSTNLHYQLPALLSRSSPLYRHSYIVHDACSALNCINPNQAFGLVSFYTASSSKSAALSLL